MSCRIFFNCVAMKGNRVYTLSTSLLLILHLENKKANNIISFSVFLFWFFFSPVFLYNCNLVTLGSDQKADCSLHHVDVT